MSKKLRLIIALCYVACHCYSQHVAKDCTRQPFERQNIKKCIFNKSLRSDGWACHQFEGYAR